MSGFIQSIFAFFVHLGGFGLLFLGILDSSFLFMPLGNDLLVIIMTANKHGNMPYYAAMATAGSVLGVLLIDIVFRKGGEKMLEKHVPKKRLDYVRKRIEQRAGWAVGLAALMPPPFPFTPFVASASALEYPRKKLLIIIALARMGRFSLEGVAAIFLGKRILSLAKSPVVQYFMIALIVLFVGGSVFSIVMWVKRSKRSGGQRQEPAAAKPKTLHAGGQAREA